MLKWIKYFIWLISKEYIGNIVMLIAMFMAFYTPARNVDTCDPAPEILDSSEVREGCYVGRDNSFFRISDGKFSLENFDWAAEAAESVSAESNSYMRDMKNTVDFLSTLCTDREFTPMKMSWLYPENTVLLVTEPTPEKLSSKHIEEFYIALKMPDRDTIIYGEQKFFYIGEELPAG